MKYLKRILLTICSTGVVGCVLPPKQVTLSDGSIGLSVRCNGRGLSWSNCYEVAKTSCPRGFDVKGREQYIVDQDIPIRVLSFKCK